LSGGRRFTPKQEKNDRRCLPLEESEKKRGELYTRDPEGHAQEDQFSSKKFQGAK